MGLKKLKEKIKELKKDIVVIYYALQDKRTPLLAKCFGVLSIAYLLSPIDLIPDFIPVLGLLDDLIIVPFLILVTIRLIPPPILDDIRKNIDSDLRLKKKWYYALPIILIYVLLTIWLTNKFFFKRHIF